MVEGQILQLVALLAVLILVLPGFLYYTRRSGKAVLLRNIAIWLGVALVVAFLYKTFGGG
ncbi:hypothetical protein [Sneathiella litorea]|uniref:Uncharacterized protein n=1 Tax=Sneathiella litorea TaxID=2606216 RepID=A0A6L8W9D2_9PROT|nr:hypothetical protein [Sneathiella litorea]MZR30980.1 hypothetical protein [Sneathiella litorea]